MTRVVLLGAVLLAMAGCKPESARKAEQAARELAEARKAVRDEGPALAKPDTAIAEAGRLAKAEQEFRRRRTLRIQVLRGEHAVVASQRLVISAMAQSFTLTDAGRADVNAKLTVFTSTLDETANVLEGLERVDANAWDERQDQAVEAMTRLDEVREQTWHALDDAVKTGRNAT